MSNKRSKVIVWLTLMPVLLGMLMATSGCFGSPAISIIIENQTDQVLSISFMGDSVGSIAPGQQIIERAIIDWAKYPIEARNKSGEIVFSEIFTFKNNDKYHLIETNEKHKGVVKVYKAVIPPLETGTGSSDNATK